MLVSTWFGFELFEYSNSSVWISYWHRVSIGVEISFGSLLSPFAVKSDLHLTKSQGSFITGSYWSTYTFLRIFSLVLIIYLSPRTLLIANFLIIMLANGILVPFANTNEWALWLGSGLMGFGCSSVFATMFGFIEQLTPITARITAGFMIAGFLFEFNFVLLRIKSTISYLKDVLVNLSSRWLCHGI